MNRQLLFRTLATMVACLALVLPANAYDFIENGIYYSIGSNGSNVTVQNDGSGNFNSYQGDIVIPSAVTHNGTTYNVSIIGYQAFKSCTGLTSVKMPETIEYIMNEAFMDCSALTEVTIPSSVFTMYQNIFKGCTSLTDVTCLWTTARSINANNFDTSTYTNATLHVPLGSKSSYQGTMPWSRFSQIEENGTFMVDGIYYNVTGSNTVEVTYKDRSYYYYSGSVNIPSSVTYAGKTYTVTAVGDYAFTYSPDMTSVTIPSTVTSIGYGAFYNCSSLTSIVIPNSVTSLGEFCFMSCENLTNVTLSNQLTSIPRQCFTYCKSLTSITIPGSVKEIYYFAFYNCESLQYVTLQEGVEQIFNNAFDSCTSLESIQIPASVEHIDETALAECYSLAYINVNSANTHYCSMDGVLFTAAMDSLLQYPPAKGDISYLVPDGVKVIGASAFSECDNLESVTLHEGLTTIGYRAFSYSDKITSLNIPASVNEIGNSFMAFCTSLVSINVAKGNQNYMSDDGVLYTSDGKLLVQYPCARPDKHYSILNSADSIGFLAFTDALCLKSVYIPSGIKIIEQDTFYGSSLERVVIDEGLERIEIDAFGECSMLKSIYLPSTLNYIASTAFQFDLQLEQITFAGSSAPLIGENAFYGVGYEIGTTEIYVPTNAVASYQSLDWNSNYFDTHVNQQSTLLSGYTFTIDSLEFEVLDDNLNVVMTQTTTTSIEDPGIAPKVSYLGNLCTVTKLAAYSLQNCTRMKRVEVPFTVQNIENYCAYRSRNVEKLILREGVKRIGAFAFSQINKLTSVDIPASVDSIRNDAFTYDPALRSINVSSANSKYCSVDGILFSKDKKRLVAFADGYGPVYTVPEGTQVIGYEAFRGASALTAVTMPTSLRKIENYAFFACSALEHVDVPHGVTSIDFLAFGSCASMTSADLPATLTELGYNAFYNVPNLSQLNVRATTPPSCQTYLNPHTGEVSEPFDNGHYSSVNLVVPTGCSQAYRTANIWKKFTNITETDFPTVVIRGDANGDGVVNISDVVTMITYLTSNNSSGMNMSGADVNGDGTVNISDVTILINYLSNGIWPEPAAIDMWYLWGNFIGSSPWGDIYDNHLVGISALPLYPVGDFNSQGKGTLSWTGFVPRMNFTITHNLNSYDDIVSEMWAVNNSTGQYCVRDMTDEDPNYSSILLEQGNYTITLNTQTMTLTIEPYLSTTYYYESITMPGQYNGWVNTANAMDPVNEYRLGVENHDWWVDDFTITSDGYAGELKFCLYDNWFSNWGANEFPYGQGLQDGRNIPCQPGTYTVFFNDITGLYHFIKK